MGSFGPILRLVAQRSLANWRLVATVVAGIVLASALMSSVVLYSDAIRELGLDHALSQEEPLDLDLKVLASSQRARPREYADLRDGVLGRLKSYAGDIVVSTVFYGKSATFYVTAPGGAVSEEKSRPRGFFQYADELAKHVRVVAGGAPAPVQPAAAGRAPAIEVWLGKSTADAFGVAVGERFDLHPFWRPEAEPVHLTVAGIIEPLDAGEEYWFGNDRFAEPTPEWRTYPFFIDERTFVTVLAGYLEDMDGTFETYGRVSQGAITGTNAKDVEGRVRALGSDLSATFERTTLRTRLPATIAEYREKLFFTRLPLFALMLQIVGIVMYYVVMVSAMVVERQAGEIALLKSRGASNMQVMGVYALEAGLLCAAGVLIGPLVALGAIAMLGLTPPFEDLSGNKLLEVNLSTGAFLMAGLGALLTFAAMLWPAYRATAYSVVHYKTHLARPPQQPAFLRYYLDLALIGVGAFAFYQLRQRGSLVTERLFGDLSADPLLLATPALFMLMIALVFLRLFPLILRVVSWGTRRLNGATVPLGLWHLVRSPLQYSRLILLLLLVTAVGMFAAGFRATLERSYDDRAGYEAGAEGRLQGVRDQGRRTTGAFVQKVGSVTGAATVSPALRIDASYSPRDISSQAITLLGVERESFEQVAFWRGDFAGRGLGGLLDTLQGDGTDEGEGVVIPGGTRFVGVWVKLSLRGNFTSLGMRVRDAEGLHWQYRLEPAGSPPTAAAPGEARADGWRFYVASLARPSAFGGPGGTPSLLEDRRVDSFYVQLGGNPMVAERHTLLLDDVTASREGAEPASWALTGFPDGVVVEDFENLERYELISGAARGAERGALARADGGANGGRFVANVAFEYSRSAARVAGLRLQAGTPVLPVAINQPFAAENKLKVGDELRLYTNAQYVTARVASVFELFPSYDPERQRRFIVADLGALQLAATRVPGPAEGLFVNEAWLAGLEGPVPTREDLVKNGLQTDLVFDRALIHAQQASDPLVAASWEGILFLAFAAVLVLTALGFIVSSHLAAQTRALEFAILRTMGFTRRQIFALVTFEQAFVIVIGLVAGTLMGLPLVRLMVGYLGLTETGSDVLPPLASRVSWEAVAISSSLLVLVFIATNMSLVVAYSRLAVHRALRMGEL